MKIKIFSLKYILKLFPHLVTFHDFLNYFQVNKNCFKSLSTANKGGICSTFRMPSPRINKKEKSG